MPVFLISPWVQDSKPTVVGPNFLKILHTDSGNQENSLSSLLLDGKNKMLIVCQGFIVMKIKFCLLETHDRIFACCDLENVIMSWRHCRWCRFCLKHSENSP